MGADRFQRRPFSDRDLAPPLDRQRADRTPAGDERRRERAARAAVVSRVADERGLAGVEDPRDQRAVGHALAAGHGELLAVADDERQLVHAQTLGQRGAQPSQ